MGPLSRDYLINVKNIDVPEVYGDPVLLLPKLYKPKIINGLRNKIGIVPHYTNFKMYVNKVDNTKYHLISPTDRWNNVVNYICSCKAIISSSLHAIICADAFNIPNLWLDEYALDEGDYKFKDYFASQKRDYIKIKKLNEYKNMLVIIYKRKSNRFR